MYLHRGAHRLTEDWDTSPAEVSTVVSCRLRIDAQPTCNPSITCLDAVRRAPANANAYHAPA